MAHHSCHAGVGSVDGAAKFFTRLAEYYRAQLHRWDRFLDQRLENLQCYFYGPCDHSPEECKYASLIQQFNEEFGEEFVREAEYYAEISGESETMNPEWDWVTYQAVKIYRAEINKFQQLKMKDNHGKT